MFLHSFKHYLSRFRWEIAIFWIVSAAASASPAYPTSIKTTLALGKFEILAAIWITLRLMLAESNLLVSGGWRTRPLKDFTLLAVQGCTLLLVIAGCFLFRGLLIQWMFAPDLAGWKHILQQSWLPGIFIWLTIATVILTIGGIVLRNAGKKCRILSAAVLAAVLLISLVRLLPATSYGQHSSSGGSSPPTKFAQSIQQQLPDGTDFIGRWREPYHSSEQPATARLLMKIPLDANAKLTQPGITPIAKAIRIEDSRIAVSIRLATLDPAWAKRLSQWGERHALPILRYADGTYATCNEYNRGSSGPSLTFVPSNEFGFDGSFISPLSLPEYAGVGHELLIGAELLLFEADPSAPPLTPDSSRIRPERKAGAQPTLPPISDSTALAEYTRKVVQQQELYGTGYAAQQQGRVELPREAFSALLATRPWGDGAWRAIVRPQITRLATEADKPVLLDLLKTEPRMASVLIEKGWSADAIPELKRIVRDRLPLEEESIVALASAQDASLSADLAAVALRIERLENPSEFESALKGQPGFDWHAFALQGWHRRKYGIEPALKSPFAVWAAREGDTSALRHIAECAARGSKWDYKQLALLVSTDVADPLAFLRANLDKLRFDPAAQRFLMP